MNAYKLWQKYSIKELVAMQEEIRANPENRNLPGSFWIYKKSADKKLKEIAWAITYHLDQPKAEQEET